VVEVESGSGEVGVGVSTGGVPAAFLIERHLARFAEGERADRIELVWDRMWRASLFYGRKGLAVNAISAVDLALWDLLGRLRGEPVLSLIGGSVHEELSCYATVPHGSSVYSYPFAVTRPSTQFVEFLMMAPAADEVVPMFQPLLLDEPVPVNGRLRVPERPGFGVELNRELELERPFAR